MCKKFKIWFFISCIKLSRLYWRLIKQDHHGCIIYGLSALRTMVAFSAIPLIFSFSVEAAEGLSDDLEQQNISATIPGSTVDVTGIMASQLSEDLRLTSLIVKPEAEAAAWKMTGFIKQYLSYDNNFIMSHNPIGSFISKTIPMLNVTHQSDQWTIRANASYGEQAYSSSIGQNQNPQAYSINSEYKMERSTLGLIGSYSSQPTRGQAGMYSGNYTSNAMQELLMVSPSYSYQISERDFLTSTAYYRSMTYTKNDFTNSEGESINVGWRRKWTERLDQSILPTYSTYHSVVSTNDTFGVNLTEKYDLSEQWSLDGMAGVRATNTTVKTTGQMTKNQGWQASLNARYNGEKLRSSVSLRHLLMPSAWGTMYQQNYAMFKLLYPLSERFSSGLDATYVQANRIDVSGGNNFTNTSLSPSLIYSLTQDCELSASYINRNLDFNTMTANGSVYMLTFVYNWPGFNLSK